MATESEAWSGRGMLAAQSTERTGQTDARAAGSVDHVTVHLEEGQSCVSDAVAPSVRAGTVWTIVACSPDTRRPRSPRPTVSTPLTLTSSSGSTVAGDGTGQTIALVETYHDPNIQASLDAFDAKYGLPHLTLKVIDQAGTQTNDDGGKRSRSTSSGRMPSPPAPTSSWWRPRPATTTLRA